MQTPLSTRTDAGLVLKLFPLPKQLSSNLRTRIAIAVDQLNLTYAQTMSFMSIFIPNYLKDSME